MLATKTETVNYILDREIRAKDDMTDLINRKMIEYESNQENKKVRDQAQLKQTLD